jgi:hypothetical protein
MKQSYWVSASGYDEDDNEIDIECYVRVETTEDGYGTGDSPTMYEIDIQHARDMSGRPYKLSAFDIERIEEGIIDDLR